MNRKPPSGGFFFIWMMCYTCIMDNRIDVGWIDPGYVSGHFAHSITNQVADMEYFKALGKIHAMIGTSLVTAARNAVVNAFLEGDSEWLWMVDSDMVFNKGHWLKLWEMAQDTGADMVTGLAFIFDRQQGSIMPSLFYEGEPPIHKAGELIVGPHLPDNGEEVAACGLASVLINRRVFEGLEAPRHKDYRWFDQIILGAGQMSGEDVQFFVRAREAGYTLRVCMEATTQHVKEIGMGLHEFRTQQNLKEKYANSVDNRNV